MATISANTPFNRARLLISTGVVKMDTTSGFKISAVTAAPTTTGAGSDTHATSLEGGLTKAANVSDVALPATISWTLNTSTNKYELKSSTTTVDISATGNSGTILGFVMWDDTPTSPANPCLSYMALDTGVALVNGDKFTLTMNTNGWLNI